MEISKKMYSVCAKDIRCEDTVEHTVESDITLPEYFPDIVSVLKATLKPNVTQTKLLSGKLAIEGTALISIIYLCEEKKMHCFEQRLPFTKTIELSKTENCYPVCEVQTQFVNCRVSSQRKLSIHSSVSIKYKLYYGKTRNILSECDEKTVQLRKSESQATVLRDCQIKSFVINETLELGTAQDSIGQIIRSDAVAILDSVKMVSGKALIKGELKVKVTYLTEKECSVEKSESSMPISQIVEVDTADDSIEYVTLSVSSVDVFAKTDSSGALRMFDLSVSVNAELNIYDEKTVECISDIYSTQYELTQKKEIVPFIKLSDRINDTYLLRASTDIQDKKIKAVLDINSRNINYSAELRDNTFFVNGTLGISAVILDENDEISCVDKELELEYRCALKTNSPDAFSYSNIVLSSMNYTINNESRIDIRAELFINAVVFENYQKEVITDIELDENNKKTKTNASLTIYFSDPGESIWNIAKRYNTTVKAILEENKLTEDILKERTKLLIPCK